MGEYCLARVWQLKAGSSATELEELFASGVLEMQRWLPGVTHLSLVRLNSEPERRYLSRIIFTSYEAYLNWRQVEEEGPDYWERYASMQMHWEQLSTLVQEYAGEIVVDTKIDNAVRAE